MQSEMDQRRCNLLLVEDQLDLAALMEQALEDGGGRVTHAYSVFDALGLLDTQRFDGAVLDVELRDGVVFPVADRLAELGIPYLFTTHAYDIFVHCSREKLLEYAKTAAKVITISHYNKRYMLDRIGDEFSEKISICFLPKNYC